MAAAAASGAGGESTHTHSYTQGQQRYACIQMGYTYTYTRTIRYAPCHLRGSRRDVKWISATHIKTVHEGRKDYACDKCEKKFGKKSHLLSHQREVHEGRRDYACDKSFESCKTPQSYVQPVHLNVVKIVDWQRIPYHGTLLSYKQSSCVTRVPRLALQRVYTSNYQKLVSLAAQNKRVNARSSSMAHIERIERHLSAWVSRPSRGSRPLDVFTGSRANQACVMREANLDGTLRNEPDFTTRRGSAAHTYGYEASSSFASQYAHAAVSCVSAVRAARRNTKPYFLTRMPTHTRINTHPADSVYIVMQCVLYEAAAVAALNLIFVAGRKSSAPIRLATRCRCRSAAAATAALLYLRNHYHAAPPRVSQAICAKCVCIIALLCLALAVVLQNENHRVARTGPPRNDRCLPLLLQQSGDSEFDRRYKHETSIAATMTVARVSYAMMILPTVQPRARSVGCVVRFSRRSSAKCVGDVNLEIGARECTITAKSRFFSHVREFGTRDSIIDDQRYLLCLPSHPRAAENLDRIQTDRRRCPCYCVQTPTIREIASRHSYSTTCQQRRNTCNSHAFGRNYSYLLDTRVIAARIDRFLKYSVGSTKLLYLFHSLCLITNRSLCNCILCELRPLYAPLVNVVLARIASSTANFPSIF
ncbi:unnamed protein product [Trichogramma brassicae]|uniref:C2H2-type domain-containing protein n=1 Tax=Trichogramma brassicae TaxID=86971 RepID=A0A6H5ICX0_9HYME|nr:unnamed protein product [Trichogramma brassicae]